MAEDTLDGRRHCSGQSVKWLLVVVLLRCGESELGSRSRKGKDMRMLMFGRVSKFCWLNLGEGS